MIEAAARAVDLSEAQLRERIAALPPLDFYVPSARQRRTWRGGRDFMVSISMFPAPVPLRAYSPEGATIYDARVPLGEDAPTLIFLHPAEPKGRRIDPQPAGAGPVIQDPGDGQLAVQYIRRSARGTPVVYDLRKIGRRWRTWPQDGSEGVDLLSLPGCPPDNPDCSGGGGGGSSWTYVWSVEVRGVCDYTCDASNEFEFRAAQGSLSGTARITGVGSGQISPYFAYWNGDAPMIATTVALGAIDVDVVETDGWPSPDDNFDPNPNLISSSNGAEFRIGDDRAQWCTGCKELHVVFRW